MANKHVYADNLKDECTVFCYYLVNQKPNDYVVKKYQEGHKVKNLSNYFNVDNLDKLLIHIANINPLLTKIVDVYTRFFHKNSVIRKKLVLLLAILESSAPTHYYLDKADRINNAIIYFRIFHKGILFLLTLMLSVIILMPVHVTSIAVSKLIGQPK